jgi:hypothetical protein
VIYLVNLLRDTVTVHSYLERWVYHSALSHSVYDRPVTVSLARVIRLSRCFITLCLWLYCNSITKKNDKSITEPLSPCIWLYCNSITKKSDTSIIVLCHALNMNVLWQYHEEDWLSISHSFIILFQRRSINLSQCYVILYLPILWQYH